MIFFVALSDLPVPPPPAPVYAVPAPIPASPVALPPRAPERRVSASETCPIGGFASDGRPCPHPAYWGLAKGSDVPGQTLGSIDPAYGKSLSDQVCEAKPWTC